MTTKFTRGPWLVSPCYLDEYDIVHYSVGPINSSDGARFVEDQICQVSSPNEPDAVVESNAHLIAAAPLMADYIHKKAIEGCADAQKIWEIATNA